MAKLKVTLTKSIIGRKKDHIATVNALGLKKIGKSVMHEDTKKRKKNMSKRNDKKVKERANKKEEMKELSKKKPMKEIKE